MRKKQVTIASELPDRLSHRRTKRLVLSRETVRALTEVELSQAVGGCPTITVVTSEADPCVL
jgi:hypothetical protein